MDQVGHNAATIKTPPTIYRIHIDAIGTRGCTFLVDRSHMIVRMGFRRVYRPYGR